MAHLGRPILELGTPHRESPTSPGKLSVKIGVTLFVDRLERCFAASCNESARDPLYTLKAEIWSYDKNEPKFTAPISEAVLLTWRWGSGSGSMYKHVLAGELASAAPVEFNSRLFSLYFEEEREMSESTFNEDHGGPIPTKVTQDEVYLRVYFSSLFTNWQFVSHVDSDIQRGQFFGP